MREVGFVSWCFVYFVVPPYKQQTTEYTEDTDYTEKNHKLTLKLELPSARG